MVEDEKSLEHPRLKRHLQIECHSLIGSTRVNMAYKCIFVVDALQGLFLNP